MNTRRGTPNSPGPTTTRPNVAAKRRLRASALRRPTHPEQLTYLHTQICAHEEEPQLARIAITSTATAIAIAAPAGVARVTFALWICYLCWSCTHRLEHNTRRQLYISPETYRTCRAKKLTPQQYISRSTALRVTPILAVGTVVLTVSYWYPWTVLVALVPYGVHVTQRAVTMPTFVLTARAVIDNTVNSTDWGRAWDNERRRREADIDNWLAAGN